MTPILEDAGRRGSAGSGTTGRAGAGPVVGRPHRSGGAEPVSVRRLVVRFVLAGLPALAAAIIVTAVASVRIGTRLGIDDAERVTWVASAVVEEQGLDDALLVGDQAALAKLDAVVRRFVVRGSLVRVKIWAEDGTVLYSNEPRLIGMRFALDSEELSVLKGDRPVDAEVSGLERPENLFETEGRLLEVYRGVKTPSGAPLLFESYFRYDDVRRTGRDLWAQFAPIAVGTLLVLELVQIPIAVSLARGLRSGQLQRERLLQHAIDSSDAERRRIARDLHDGPVQDLTGVSMSLAATARGAAPGPMATMMARSGIQLRETIRSLRSMLVDIYPPNLYEEGLESAITDLLAGLHNRGVYTQLAVDPGAATLSREAASLLYRAAQEAIRNAATHAQAGEIFVEVYLEPDEAVLVVEDSGRGFDELELAGRARAGHIGLRGTADLIADAGGRLEVRSSPGKGTYVRVGLPR